MVVWTPESSDWSSAAIRRGASCREIGVNGAAICCCNELCQALSHPNGRSPRVRGAVKEVGCLVEDCLSLELGMVFGIDSRPDYPKGPAKTDDRCRSVLAGWIYEHKRPITRTASGIVTNIPNHVTRDQISDAY